MDPKLRKLTEQTENPTRQIRNLKSKIRRRQKKLGRILDPLERQRMDAEIQLLQKKVTALTLEEIKDSVSIIRVVANSNWKSVMDEIDWSKAGKA